MPTEPRNPKVLPKPGDQLRGVRGHLVTVTRVKGTIAGLMVDFRHANGHKDSTVEWEKLVKDATVAKAVP